MNNGALERSCCKSFKEQPKLLMNQGLKTVDSSFGESAEVEILMRLCDFAISHIENGSVNLWVTVEAQVTIESCPSLENREIRVPVLDMELICRASVSVTDKVKTGKYLVAHGQSVRVYNEGLVEA